MELNITFIDHKPEIYLRETDSRGYFVVRNILFLFFSPNIRENAVLIYDYSIKEMN